MNKLVLSGLALLLAGCPKTQNAVEQPVAPASSPSVSSPSPYTPFSLDVAPQLIAAYLVKKEKQEDGIYGTKEAFLNTLLYENKVFIHDVLLMYKPEGVQGSYADDQFIVSLPSKDGNDILMYDTGLDGKLDMVTDTQDTTPWLSFDSLVAEQQEFLTLYYTHCVTEFAKDIRETYDVKQLKEVRPQ